MMLQAFFVILLVIQEMGYTARHERKENGSPTNAARAEAYAAVYPPVASALEQGRQVRS
jgi:predicted kinase